MGFSRGRLIEFALSVSGVSGRTEYERHTHDLLRDLCQPDSVARQDIPGAGRCFPRKPYVGHTAHQILIVTRFGHRVVPSGWILTRSRPPFTPRDVDAADQVLPLLVLLDGLHLDGLSTRSRSTARPVLTGRELEVLQLLPLGLTAEAMGRQLSISGRTVRKHLEHIYSKLQCHDRLVAVLRARELQLL